MGLDDICLRFICDHTSPDMLSIGTLGVQDMVFTPGQTPVLAEAHPETARRLAEMATPIQDTVLKALGFKQVETMDVSPADSPTHILDLNRPLPRALAGRYDVLLDGGTLEHVFDMRQALENVADMVRPQGLVLHINPINNNVNHGFYQFSPTFYFDWYGTNGFTDMRLALFYKDAFIVFDEHDPFPPVMRALSKPHSLCFFSATKAEARDAYVVPTQAVYRGGGEVWHNRLQGKKVMVWGTSGRYAERYKPWVETNQDTFNFIGFIDNDPHRQGQTAHGKLVFPPQRLLEGDVEVIVVASCFQEAILTQIYDMDVFGPRIVW